MLLHLLLHLHLLLQPAPSPASAPASDPASAPASDPASAPDLLLHLLLICSCICSVTASTKSEPLRFCTKPSPSHFCCCCRFRSKSTSASTQSLSLLLLLLAASTASPSPAAQGIAPPPPLSSFLARMFSLKVANVPISPNVTRLPNIWRMALLRQLLIKVPGCNRIVDLETALASTTVLAMVPAPNFGCACKAGFAGLDCSMDLTKARQFDPVTRVYKANVNIQMIVQYQKQQVAAQPLIAAPRSTDPPRPAPRPASAS
ncbi:hypothetical protein BASA83_002479 [Batrachochytrium salamandrivorans]|nr:hypothetical protein BASA83_002479 [Batrachochytrium salamandrivorans]